MASSTPTVRFSVVVAKTGRPTTYLLWSDPKKDPGFQRATKDQRVMTVHRTLRGGHKDFGEIGYVPDRHAQFLLFPKSLRRFEGKRVVGIDYDLLAVETTSGSAPAPARTQARTHRTSHSASRGVSGDVVSFPRGAGGKPDERTASVATSRDRGREQSAPKMRARQYARAETPSAKRSPASHLPVLDAATATEIRRAAAELKAGKAVAAYERLAKLLGSRT